MKVCILAAGMGTRLGMVSKYLHKALLPLGNRAVISHIIEQFQPGTRIVVATGHMAGQVESFLRLAHPELPIEFAPVALYTGPGAGPGRSLLACRERLAEPFVFTSCDTLIRGALPDFDSDWIGVSEVDDPGLWCAVRTSGQGRTEQVSGLDYKSKDSTARLAFTGIAFVKDHRAFWEGLSRAGEAGQAEMQINPGLEALISSGLGVRYTDWRDTGNWESYQALLPEYAKNFTFAGKTTEITYRYGDRVLKTFPGADKAAHWIKRARGMGDAVPELLGCEGASLAYRFVPGELLSEELNGLNCRAFLDWLENRFWREADLDEAVFAAALREFYVTKSLQRLDAYKRRFPDSDAAGPQTSIINGEPCRPARELVEAAAGIVCAPVAPSVFHGDLHADNVLRTAGGFCLIDWRSDFAGLDVGDRYYDLGKFLHTLDLSVATMEAGAFDVLRGEDGSVRIEHDTRFCMVQARDAFFDFCRRRGYDLTRVRVVNALVFLNMSPLYEAPMSEYLCLLGRLLLEQALSGRASGQADG